MGTRPVVPPQVALEGASKPVSSSASATGKGKARERDAANAKRRCVSTACIACRKRKSKCDGNLPSCAACASVYGTACVYDPNSDHRRRGVYKKDIDGLKTKNSTLETLIQGILSQPEHEAIELVKEIRTSGNLDDVAEKLVTTGTPAKEEQDESSGESGDEWTSGEHRFERVLGKKMGEIRLEMDAIRFIGGTSNLLYDDSKVVSSQTDPNTATTRQYLHHEDAIRSWTTATTDVDLIIHLLNMYFTWHYTFFTTLSKKLFFQDFFRGKPLHDRPSNEHCTPLLVNAMLALGCHFTAWPGARANPLDPATAGDHFFREAKRWFVDNDEYESSRLATVQALALMSVHEAGRGREAAGWIYSGMSFRMAYELGLCAHSDVDGLSEHDIDARRITFWGCFLFDKCWSNYLGRPPQIPLSNIAVSKFEVFPTEDADVWSPWTDQGLNRSIARPSRIRAVALLTSTLCEISNDILLSFYSPRKVGERVGKQIEIQRIGDLHMRLETWKRDLPSEFETSDGQLPHVLVMHMFYNSLFLHLFKAALKYSSSSGALPNNVQPRRLCVQAATTISKLLRTYKRVYGLRQICNIVVYMVHAASTIHLLTLPDKAAQRDISHNVRALEEIGESWLCARRALLIIYTQARKWNVEVPGDAIAILQRAKDKYSRDFSTKASQEYEMSIITPPIASPAILPSHFTTTLDPSPRMQIKQKARLKLNTSNESSDSALPYHMYSPNTFASKYNLASPPSSGILSSGLVTASPSSMVAGSYQDIDDNEDWWSQGQQADFDHWSTPAASSLSVADQRALQPGRTWNARTSTTGGNSEPESAPRIFSNGSLDEANESDGAHDLDYLGFPSA